jgi:hypothetical protein
MASHFEGTSTPPSLVASKQAAANNQLLYRRRRARNTGQLDCTTVNRSSISIVLENATMDFYVDFPYKNRGPIVRPIA